MKTEQQIKNKHEELNNIGSKSKQAENILFAKIDILKWVLSEDSPLVDKLIKQAAKDKLTGTELTIKTEGK